MLFSERTSCNSIRRQRTWTCSIYRQAKKTDQRVFRVYHNRAIVAHTYPQTSNPSVETTLVVSRPKEQSARPWPCRREPAISFSSGNADVWKLPTKGKILTLISDPDHVSKQNVRLEIVKSLFPIERLKPMMTGTAQPGFGLSYRCERT